MNTIILSRMQFETPIHFGREVKRADITILNKDHPLVPYIIVELKKPKLTDGKEQLKSYCNATRSTHWCMDKWGTSFMLQSQRLQIFLK